MPKTRRLMDERAGAGAHGQGAPPCILIAGDEEMDRELGHSLLEGAGHQLLFAAHGELALRMYETHEVDVVVTDLAMPYLDGLRLIKEILAIDEEARIIAVSGVRSDELVVAERLGAVRTMVKPFQPEELLEVVSEVLGGSKESSPDDVELAAAR